jgi:glutamine synthetase
VSLIKLANNNLQTPTVTTKTEQKWPTRLQDLQAHGVDTARVTYADIHGVARGKDVPLAHFPRLVEEGLAFCAANLTDGLAFSLTNLPARPAEPAFPDMRVRLLPSTLVGLPWEPATAWCLAQIDPADIHSAKSPRNILVRAVSEYEAMGLRPITAVELEFYVLERQSKGLPTRSQDQLCMTYTMGNLSDPSGLVRTLLRYANQIELDATTAHHECGRGQYEINLNHGDALDSADRAFRFKHMVKEVAGCQGMLATFMGKPFADDAGSGLHLHLSLHDDRGNRFFDANATDGLSQLARHFLAGVLEHAPALTALYCPTINSYKRLVPGTLVPLAANWGYDNRTAYVRVPAERGQATRLELRAADAAANPYVVTAASLLAGLDGIKRKLQPPRAFEFDGPSETATSPGLPARLEDSLRALRNDSYLLEALGGPFVDAFCAAKAVEADRYRLHITEWEFNEYAWPL